MQSQPYPPPQTGYPAPNAAYNQYPTGSYGYPPQTQPQQPYATYPPADSYQHHAAPQPYAQYGNNPYEQPLSSSYPKKEETDVIVDDGSNGGASSYISAANRAVQRGFIRKVYGILTVQLIITFGIVLAFSFIPALTHAVQTSPGILWGAYGTSIAALLVLTCCQKSARSYPMNYILLGIFTLCEGYLVGAIAAFYAPVTVVKAVALTIIITGALTVYAWQTKVDYTTKGGVVLALALGLLFFGFFAIFSRNDIVQTVYCCLGALVMCFFIIFDTQMILGGNHKNSFSTEDYVFAALSIYLDVVQLFLFILRLLGKSDRR